MLFLVQFHRFIVLVTYVKTYNLHRRILFDVLENTGVK